MSLTQPLGFGVFRPRIMLIALIAIAAIAAVARPAEATAAVSGQQEAWPLSWGFESGELHNPLSFGVDSTDGSVFIGDLSPDLAEYRVQKFSDTGDPLGSVAFPRPAGGELGSFFIGIAVDPSLNRFYLLQAALEVDSGEPGKAAALKVLAYSTEPSSGALVPAPVPELPVPPLNGAETLLEPQEIAVDPSNGDLVISAENRDGDYVLQRIGSNGTPGPRYVETGTTINETPSFRGFAVGDDGVTYIVTDNTDAAANGTRAYTLPAGFTPPTLAPLPGFAEAAVSESWPFSVGQRLITDATLFPSAGLGPQVAISSAADGDQTLYYKVIFGTSTLSSPGNLPVRGFSLEDEATSVVYGELLGVAGVEGDCLIQTSGAALGTVGQDLVVLDQGEFVETESGLPSFGPNVFRFGPGGTECPMPAAAIGLKDEGGADVTNVPEGATVTLDAGDSELGGETLEDLTWKVEGPGGGTETLHPPGSPPALELDHVFAEEGTYTIRLNMKTSLVAGIGTNFAAKSKRLVVAEAPAKFNLAVTTSGTGTGTVTSSPAGVNCGVDCDEEYDSGTAVTLEQSAAVGSEFKGWTGCDSIEAGNCKVTMSAAKSVEAKFDTAVAPKFNLAVTKSGTGTGTVTGTGINCGVDCAQEYDQNTVVTLTQAAGVGSDFKGWTGCGSEEEGGKKCKVTMSAAKSVNAKFDAEPQAKFKLSVAKSGIGGGTVTGPGIDCGADCAEEYDEGTTVTLTAAAAAGSTFAGWGGDCSGTGSCTVGMNAAKSVTASFAPIIATLPPPRTCATDPSLCPKGEDPKPKPLKCKKGFKKKKVKGKARCVKVKNGNRRNGKGSKGKAQRPGTDLLLLPPGFWGKFF
ncbi:MAG TPA: hypothetical protein VFI03_03215 [Solirubrobacterales bacterium]|nr:hypothetical protein [Solirubrobacterales bacterium]